MIIDALSHILSLAADPEFTVEYGREGSLCIYRSMGRGPSHRLPTDDKWEANGFSRAGWPLIGPDEAAPRPSPASTRSSCWPSRLSTWTGTVRDVA